MFRFRQQSKSNKHDDKQAVPQKEQTPVSATTDPYIVNIVRLLEKLRIEKKH